MQPPRLRLLTTGQKRMLLAILAGSGVLLANSVYLVLAAHVGGVGDAPDELPLTYQLMLLVHVVLGLLLVVPALVFSFWHLRLALRNRRPGTLPSGAAVLVLAVFLALSGLFIMTAANSAQNRWAFVGHQVAAVLLPVAYLLHRLLGRDRLRRESFLKGLAGMGAVVLVLALVHILETGGLPERPQLPEGAVPADLSPDDVLAQPLHDPFIPFRPAAWVDPESPFHPSAATTSTGGPLPARIIHHDDFPDLEAFRRETREFGFAPNWYLGAQTCRRCHPDIVEQWAVSVHRFASFNNPFYRKAVEFTRDKHGKDPSLFCGGCHDPAVMLAGNMREDIDPLTPEAQAGLTCLACHAIDRIHNLTGNGAYNIQDEEPSPYAFFSATEGWRREISDFLVKSKPTVHKRRMLKPFFKTSEFCSVCHKVNLDVAVNGYKWLRGQNEYDAWHDSGAARNNPMTWYEPPEVRTCQDCHMPLEPAVLGDVSADEGLVRSHRFLSVNTALPAIRGDEDTLRRIREIRRDSVRLDVFAVHREEGGSVLGLTEEPVPVHPGEEIRVDVVVRNKGVGHTFPGGTNDSNQAWIDFQVLADGKTIFHSGAVDEERYVDPAAHFFKAVFVDADGNLIDKRNVADIHTSVYVNVIPPSGSDVARYVFRVPEDLAGRTLEIRAALRWRKFNRFYTEFVFEGREVPDLPIDTLAVSAARLAVVTEGSSAAPQKRDEDWVRFNDYGIGLYLDGDTLGALEAFAEVARLAPERPDGWRNQARTLLKDGNIEGAEAMLRRASEADPDDPKTAFFWGMLLEESGRLEKAAEAYRQVLVFYPESRGTWARLGQTFWRMGRLEDSLKAWLQVLRIDPENANAHHKRALIYKAMAAREEDPRRASVHRLAWKEAEKAYLKYKDDETAQEVTLRYRLSHPHDNRMSQPIVIHELERIPESR